ncbi:MAG: hypothetical protein M1840_002168 [Geoglossum simile]|nr:MAG: hypothetical protein M1840_002168 [Geoglossum simile]
MSGAVALDSPDEIHCTSPSGDTEGSDNAAALTPSERQSVSSSATSSAVLDHQTIPDYSLDPQNPGVPYRINNTAWFPSKSILRAVFGGKKKANIGLSPDCRFAFFNSEKRVVVFSLSEKDNSEENESENAPYYEWRGHAVAVAMGKWYIAMITSDNKLLVEGYYGDRKGVRWSPHLEEIAKGSISRLAICDTTRVVLVAAAVAVPGQTGQTGQQPQEKKDRGAVLIYSFPASTDNSNPARQPRPTLARESIDVAPDFVSFDPLGEWLLCITKVSTAHMVRVWSLAEEARLCCSEIRNVGDEIGVSGLTSSLLFSFPPFSSALGQTTRTYALTTSGRSSTKHYPDESAFLLRIPQLAQQGRQIRNFQVPRHRAISSAAIPPQVNVVAFLDKGGPKAEVYLLPLRELSGSLVGGRESEIKRFRTRLGGEVAMGFTSQGDKLLVVNQEGLIWQLGFTANNDITESPGQPIELPTTMPKAKCELQG